MTVIQQIGNAHFTTEVFTIFAHGFRGVPHLHLVATRGKLAVRQGQPQVLPSFRLVLQVDLQLQ